MAEADLRHCQFCDLRLPPAFYSAHLRDQHRMIRVRPDTSPEDRVSCMFCQEAVLEVEYLGHVFHHHRISGLYQGGEGVNYGRCQESKHAQTGDDEEILVDGDQQKDEYIFTSSHVSTAKSMTTETEYNSASADVIPNDLEDEDSEESDFEMDCQCGFCLHADMEHEGAHTTDVHSASPQKTLPDDQTVNIHTDVQRFENEPESPKPKKVTFANITNYYPVKKLGWLEKLKFRAGKNVKSQILGPDTTLKYLKYWGSSEKPRADTLEMRKSRRASKNNREIEKESEASLRSLGVAVMWHCPKDGCQFTGKNILSVRKHFYSHFPSK